MPLHTILTGRKITLHIIIILLYILISIPVTTAYTRSGYVVPPPLPENEWVGHTNLNYNLLHERFVETLTCLYVPIGVLGTYMWLSMIIVAVCCILKLAWVIMKEITPQWTILTMGFLATAWALFNVWQNGNTLIYCSGAEGFFAVRTQIILALCAAVFTAAGGLVMISVVFPASGGRARRFLASTAIICLALGLVAHYLVGAWYFFAVTKSAHILTDVIKNPDSVKVAAMVVSFLPWIIITLVTLSTARDIDSLGRVLALAALELVFASGAAGNVIFGKIVGDPWGNYLLRTSWGKATVSLTAVMPLLEGGLVFVPFYLHKRSSGAEDIC